MLHHSCNAGMLVFGFGVEAVHELCTFLGHCYMPHVGLVEAFAVHIVYMYLISFFVGLFGGKHKEVSLANNCSVELIQLFFPLLRANMLTYQDSLIYKAFVLRCICA